MATVSSWGGCGGGRGASAAMCMAVQSWARMQHAVLPTWGGVPGVVVFED